MRPRWLLLPVVLFALAAGIWLLSRPADESEPARLVTTRLFEQVFAKVRSASVDPLDEQELYRRAAAGVIDELDDPYAVLLLPGEHPPPPEDAPVAQGLYLDRRDGLIVIVATVPGSPADSAGVRAQLALAVVRGSTPRPAAVETALLGGGVARVRVLQFRAGIADSVRGLLEELRAQGTRSVVLDLRGTVGGELQQGVELADLFIDAGKTLAVSRARPPAGSASFLDHSPSPFAAMPLAVLINAGTAGAAEVVAGALQDHDRAAVFGSISFGRGVTQTTFRLADGVSLSLTTSLWLTPSGRQIQRPPRPATGDSLPRPAVKSDGGRVLLGGGGIIPDRQIAEQDKSDLALAEARSVLLRAGSPGEVLVLVARDSGN